MLLQLLCTSDKPCYIQSTRNTVSSALIHLSINYEEWCAEVGWQYLDLWCKSYWILNNSADFFLKNKKNQNCMFLKNLGFLFVFLENHQQVGFNGGDSRFFRPKLWENFAKSTWSLNINLKNYFFAIGVYPQDPVHTWSSLDYSAHSWGPLEHATLITLKWRWLLKWRCAVGMVSWQHKLK